MKAPLDTLELRFAEGDYSGVAATPDVENADLLAIKARALLAEEITASGEPDLAIVRRAETYARAALDLDPRHIEARMQLAIALSLQARTMSLGEASRSGYGTLARDLAESVLEDDPGNFYAHSFLAVWHVEVIRRGGPIGATIVGASLDTAAEHFRSAVIADPDNASVYWSYARALAALDPRRFNREIDAILARASACLEDSELESTMKARAMALKDLVDRKGPGKAVSKWAAEQL